MAATVNHVFEYENELNDNLYNLKMSGNNKNNNKNKSASRKVRKLLKPLLRLLKKKSYKFAKSSSQKAEPQSEIFTEEVDNQNNSNEALEQRLLADLANAEEGAAITVCLDGQMTVVPVVPGQCYVPVHFAHTCAGDFYWTTISLGDSDLCYKERAFSQNQLPEMQVA
ncbi:enhancer of split malpha protein-like [Microplitis mediator]|uniref:enhancer of split malpha protein-like n=1 Tax=Microplitis mediator TaxID=375433 RepID=UPI002552C405|nr:enhancer of split malpha protein-like [Microplitis mediator]